MSPKHTLGVFFLSWFLLLPLSAGADTELRARLEQLRDQSQPVVADVPLASVQLLNDFYRRRNDGYAWHSSRQVEGLLRLAEHSVEEGFRPSDFHAQAIGAASGGLAPSALPASARVDVELLLSDGLLRLIHHYRYGKVAPKNGSHTEGPYADDLIDDLERIVLAQDLPTAVEGLAPRPFFYTQLKEGLARYRRIAAAGGWPTLPAGKSLRPHMRDSRVPIVRERLRATGDFNGPTSASPLYDQALKAAVLAFQKRHHLRADAVVGPATRAAMNVSVEKRIDQIRINLERMRWIADEFPDDFVLVNIPEQRVEFFRDGQAVWSSRAIVGRRARPTPAFRDQMEYLEINPRWTVPPTILKKDILPAMRRNPGYLRRKGLQVVTRGGKPVSPRSINWRRVSSKNFPYLIRQPPGARNALGRIKFMFPNDYSVYLHDTPSRGLFRRSRRLFSSGCVRVERPWELAELVLNDPGRWSKAQLKRVVASKRTRWVRLEEPLTVVLAYWTAEGDTEEEEGKVLFWEDIYRRDVAMLSALDGRGQLRIRYQRPVEPAAADDPAASEEQEAEEPETASDPPLREGALAHTDDL